MARSLAQVLSVLLFALVALTLGAQAHRNADSFGNSRVRSAAHDSLPTHIQDIIQRRSLLHGPGGPFGPWGGDKGGYGYGGKSWFKGPHKRRQN